MLSAPMPPAYDGPSAPPASDGWVSLPCGESRLSAAAAATTGGGRSAHTQAQGSAYAQQPSSDKNIQELLACREWNGTGTHQDLRRWYSVDADGDVASGVAVNKLRVLNRVEEKLGKGTVSQVPKLIVLGSSDTGKSTVLNRFIQFKVLAARGEVCTKRPVRVQMRGVHPTDARFGNSDATGGGHQTLQAIVVVEDAKDGAKKEYELRGETPDAVEGGKGHLAMLQYVEERSAPADNSIWKKIKGVVPGSRPPPTYIAEELVITIVQPGMPHFDLIDLPGLDNFNAQTTRTIQEYFNKDTIRDTFILVFRDVTAAPRKCTFVSLFYTMLLELMTKSSGNEHPLTAKDLQHRIFGICTKVDKVLEGANPGSNASEYNQDFARKMEIWFTDDGAREWNSMPENAKNKVPTIEWMAVLNPNRHEADANMTFSEASQKEAWFYDTLFMPGHAARKRCGIDAVRTRLMQKYADFCTERVQRSIWPEHKTKVEATATKLEGWGWDPREEGTEADQLAVVTEVANELLGSAEQLSKDFWKDHDVKEVLKRAEATSSIDICRKGLVGDTVDPTKAGIFIKLLKTRIPCCIDTAAASTSITIGDPASGTSAIASRRSARLTKFEHVRAVCRGHLEACGRQHLERFRQTYVEKLEPRHIAESTEELAAGTPKSELNCYGIVYQCKDRLRRADGVVNTTFKKVRHAVVTQINAPLEAGHEEVDAASPWFAEGRLSPVYAQLCLQFRREREVAEELKETFGVGKGVVGVIGGRCPPVPKQRM